MLPLLVLELKLITLLCIIISIVKSNDIESLISQYQEQGMEPTEGEYNILHLAAQYGTPEALRALINIAPELINQQSKSGYTPLEVAIQQQNTENYKLILNNEHFNSPSAIIKTISKIALIQDAPLIEEIFEIIASKNFQFTTFLEENVEVMYKAFEAIISNNQMYMFKEIIRHMPESLVISHNGTQGFCMNAIYRSLIEKEDLHSGQLKEVSNIIMNSVKNNPESLTITANSLMFASIEYLISCDISESTKQALGDVIEFAMKPANIAHINQECSNLIEIYRERDGREKIIEFCREFTHLNPEEFLNPETIASDSGLAGESST